MKTSVLQDFHMCISVPLICIRKQHLAQIKLKVCVMGDSEVGKLKINMKPLSTEKPWQLMSVKGQ